MTCPKCGVDVPGEPAECPRCGVIFARVPRVPVRFAPQEIERTVDGRIGGSEIRILGLGLVIALVAHAVPQSRFVFSSLVTLFHELGHAVAGWLMGYPSLPAFDLVYGGGLTHHGAFRLPIAMAVAAGFVWIGWHFRSNRKSLAIIGVLALVWFVFVTREWRREVVFAAAGHLGELVLAGVLFYKALSGVGWRAPLVERPAGAFVGFFVLIHSGAFAWRLRHDPDFLVWYREGKGGALMNDLEVIALNLQIWLGVTPGIEGLAGWLLVGSFLPIPLAFLWFFQRARLHRTLRALTTAEA